MNRLTKLFSPFAIGSMQLKNRIVMPAMGTNLANPDGSVTEKLTDYYVARARGGAGLITVEITTIDPRAKTKVCATGMWDDNHIRSWSELVKRIHEEGAKIAIQLAHPGRQSRKVGPESHTVAPSPIPCPVAKDLPRELRIEEIHELIERFGEGARRAKEAGFDAVEIHGAHGYLISQFMSAYSNKRSDDYGGDLEGRLRFPLEIIEKVRSKVGRDYPLIFRLSAEEGVPDGRFLNESLRIAPILAEAGIDAFHISAGVWGRMEYVIPPMGTPYGVYAPYAEAIKKVVHVPIIAVGRMNDPRLAEEILEHGKADLIAMGRALIADPDLPKKAAAGNFDEIRPCIGCTFGCMRRIGVPGALIHIGCTVNPFAGKEKEAAVVPAKTPKRVVVVGGGPAGLEAARVAALRGHQVTLFEKAEKLGGQINLAAIPPFKQEITQLIKYYSAVLSKLGVKVELKTEFTPAALDERKPDVVILAAGSTPLVPKDLPGVNKPNVVIAHDLLAGRTMVGEKVVIVGGGMVGCETADFLCERGHQVTVVEMLEDIGLDLLGTYKIVLMKRLAGYGIRKITSAKVKEILDDGIVMIRDHHEEVLRGMDHVVLAMGVKSVKTLADEMKSQAPKMYAVGDASKPGNLLEAIAGGAEVARSI